MSRPLARRSALPFYRLIAGCAAVFACAQLLASHTARAEESASVDIELVLLADASGSIDNDEIMFQRRGYASAFRDPEVVQAMTRGRFGGVAVAYVEWGDEHSQDIVVDWTLIDGAEAAARFADALMKPPRKAYGRNAIGAALVKAATMLKDNRFTGDRLVIDFSADSANNWRGPTIREGRNAALRLGATINGLAVLCRSCSGRPGGYDLEAAFGEKIVGGPGSFVVTADSRETFADAVKRKILKELLASNAPEEGSKLR